MALQEAGMDAKPEATLNERLNRLSEKMQQQCQRIEDALGRVNGNASNRAAGTLLGAPTPINPTLPLTTVVEHLESVQARLTELVHGIKRIA